MRWFLGTVAFALLIGFMFKLIFSDPKIERIVRRKLEDSPFASKLTLRSASLSLADGAWPDFSLVLDEVEWHTVPVERWSECHAGAPVRARSVRIPLRLLSLVEGEPAAGRIKIDDLYLDLDGLKDPCGQAAHAAASDRGVPSAQVAARSAPMPTTPTELFSIAQSRDVGRLFQGLVVDRAEIFFEDRMKSVLVESLSADLSGAGTASARVEVATVFRFPPATVFGESLPAFSLTGTIAREQITAEVRADLSEGTLESQAVLKPVLDAHGGRELVADFDLGLKNLPLSILTPVLTKSGIVAGQFKPKFVWLDCTVGIRGIFSRLFVDHPLELSLCQISGQVGQISVAKASRRPDGQWQPFDVAISNLALGKVFEIFALDGPSGVFAEFGRFNGKIHVESKDSVGVEGSIRGANIRVMGGDGIAALQPVGIGRFEAALGKRQWSFLLGDVSVEGGEADAVVSGKIDEKSRSGSVDLKLELLKLSPRVEKALLTGPVETIAGSGSVGFETGRLKTLNGLFHLRNWRGTDFSSDDVEVSARTVGGEIGVQAKAAVATIPRTGALFQLIGPTLLGTDSGSADSGLRVGKVAVTGKFVADGFRWEKAAASVVGGPQLASSGRLQRGNQIEATIEAQFPAAKQLRWRLGGSWYKPVHQAESAELADLLKRFGMSGAVTAVVPRRQLGLTK